MKKYITILFPLLFAISIFAQMPVSELSKKTHVRQLKEGVLLVQLPNSDKKIEILEANGKKKLAKKEKEEIAKIRKKIIDGFLKDWDVSEILFFESENTKEVFKKNFNFMLDREMNPLKELPNFEHYYSVRYGTGNPNGEVYRYNGEGLQIRYLKDGKLQSIKSDLFYNGPRNTQLFRTIMFGIFFSQKAKKTKLGLVGYLNHKIKNVKL